MNSLLVLIDLALMALLPATFFRRGTFGPRWWLVAAPFLLCGVTLLRDLVHPMAFVTSATLSMAASVMAALALGLILAARAAHAEPVPLWQQAEMPRALVASGPYARIRHPFYAAFGLVLLAAALSVPHPLTVVALAWGLAALTWTAASEERAWLGSPLADAYRAYLSRTGRFIPRLRRRS